LERLGHQRKGYAMRTYEYRCKKCGHRFEKFQNIKDQPEKVCPLCHGEVERLIGSGGGIIFKGSGFYITDYRSESYRRRTEEVGETFSRKAKDKGEEAAET
jgi:putative FmdB family regulatory protein